jgi:hypothetical protein
MSQLFILIGRQRVARLLMSAAVVVAVMAGVRPAQAQSRDSLMNGTIIGAATGAGLGVAFTHATRDSDLGFTQYAYGALVFGAIGAGAGVGIDALLTRGSRPVLNPRRLLIAPSVWRNVAGVAVRWRW